MKRKGLSPSSSLKLGQLLLLRNLSCPISARFLPDSEVPDTTRHEFSTSRRALSRDMVSLGCLGLLYGFNPLGGGVSDQETRAPTLFASENRTPPAPDLNLWITMISTLVDPMRLHKEQEPEQRSHGPDTRRRTTRTGEWGYIHGGNPSRY